MPHKGYKKTDEAKAKISKAVAKNHAEHPRTHTQETKDKIARQSTGRIVSEETRKKIGDIHRGKIISDEHRAKISAKLKGHKVTWLTPEVRKRQGQALSKTLKSKEYHDKIDSGEIINKNFRPIGSTTIIGGYVYEKVFHGGRNHKGWTQKHRLIVERSIGRKLETGECVHHIDGNKTNNDLSNLLLMSNKNHNRMNMLICVLNSVNQSDGTAIVHTLRHRHPELF